MLKKIRNFILIRTSRFFDKDWYLAQNPDVAQTKVNPYLHYLQYGSVEGRDPSPHFSSQRYFSTYPDVRASGLNPLVHYLLYGQKEGRLVEPVCSTSRYACPICQAAVDRFQPLPAVYKENFDKYGYPYTQQSDIETTNLEQYSCSRCGASDRERLYAVYLKERLAQYPEGKTICLLDIAPSPTLTRFLAAYNQVRHITADKFTASVDYQVDITDMPEISTASFDILICSHVLEHVQDDRKALAELYRVLKPGGWAIIMTPIVLTLDQIEEDPNLTDEAERWRRFGQYDHVRLYNKAGFVERVGAAGFHVRQLGIDYFGNSLFEKYGLIDTSVLYVAEKE